MYDHDLFGQPVEEWDEADAYQHPPASNHKYVRRVPRPRDRPWQARVPVGPHSNSPRLNLGCYPNPREAWGAVKTWLKSGKLPPDILPTYVRRNGDGTYSAACRRDGVAVAVGPVATPEEASRLIEAALVTVPPRPRKPKPRRPVLF